MPQVIGSYSLGRVLGSGGMGVVYEATDRRDESKVALKLTCPQSLYHFLS